MAREIEELMEAIQMLEVLNREKDEFSLDTSMIHIDTDGIKNEVLKKINKLCIHIELKQYNHVH